MRYHLGLNRISQIIADYDWVIGKEYILRKVDKKREFLQLSSVRDFNQIDTELLKL